ncbi:MAG TPA: sulfite exporter TauE/SafE family protein, partial [Desulfurivibrionaceae bacterium]|nr:sulfite exporter TauE/SafE family protein [Desulfurivibrionaceae bacterium]
DERFMALLFALMALTSLVLLLFPATETAEPAPVPSQSRYPAAVLLGGGVGFLAGIIGQGGAFIILPLMIHVLKVPVRTAIGTTVAVSFLSAAAGFLGKWGTNQVPLLWGVIVAAGALAGGQLGGVLSHRLSTVTLRRLLFLVVAVSMVRIFLLAF